MHAIHYRPTQIQTFDSANICGDDIVLFSNYESRFSELRL